MQIWYFLLTFFIKFEKFQKLKDKNTIYIGYFLHNNKNGYGANFFGKQFTILGKRENDNIEGFAIIIPLIDLKQPNNMINTNNE